MKVAITGATGLVGQRLVDRLHKSHQVVVFTRSESKAQKIFPASSYPNLDIVVYQPTATGAWQDSISGCDAVVNLAGAPIAEQRWTESYKQEILTSRQGGTEKIVEAIAKATDKPKTLINASAVGYYGTSETATLDETSPMGNDFLADICQKWEAAAEKARECNTRTVILRFGIVLAKEGGALAKMLLAFNTFVGGPLGTGKQWVSWIHRDDLVNLIEQALLAESWQGTYNATAPNPVTMQQLADALGRVVNRPSWLPVPGFVLELLLSDGAKVVLEGQKVLPTRTQAAGFNFRFPEVQAALQDLL
ncbi:TIGR01777 family oxidoreductase [[Limnothrix rosea] IAM M-220]|uniref:thylakoid membrane protein ThyD n=1 Tax=[Limnothrix rosea] IAM M-220 TaxID=454133 RepID=UPI00095CC913|nr:TIGR01777 family oxidoreductase [[Limnothrix rosea] IAM M-220]OKH15918.1 TIGR01777 family protein [[Limnothrix rosea] IAM M-220]